LIQGVCVRKRSAGALNGLGVLRAGTASSLSFAALLVGLAASALWHGPTSSVTYHISISETVSAGSGASTVQPVLALISVIPLTFALAVAFPSFIVLVALRKQNPFSGLRVLAHLRNLECAPSHSRRSRTATFWLPIESISAGRLTSKMLRTPNFFGPGRL